jgi:hypothetical protein
MAGGDMGPQLSGLELFQRAADARGQILGVQRLEGGGSESRSPGFLLTFDVGRILVRADPARGALVAEHLQSREEEPGALKPAAEEEPWWRILGNPITRVWELDEGSDRVRGYRLQFRADADDPLVVVLEPEGGLVRAAVES